MPVPVVSGKNLPSESRRLTYTVVTPACAQLSWVAPLLNDHFTATPPTVQSSAYCCDALVPATTWRVEVLRK